MRRLFLFLYYTSFCCMAPMAQNSKLKCFEYWIDSDYDSRMAINLSNEEFLLDIDAGTFPEGLHTLNYRIQDGQGNFSSLNVHKFYRVVPSKHGSKITKYRFWWNDYLDKAIDVQLSEESAEFLYEETLVVPDYARYDGFSDDYSARFSIVFTDDNGNHSAIQPAVVFYKDVIPPVTTVTVDNAVATDSVTILWTANEKSANIFNVYYSENDSPYILWKANTTDKEAIFCGRNGGSYKFIVTSHDASGNYEAMEESKAVKVEFK